MRIRMKIPVNGVFHNIVEGVRVGDVVDVDDDNGLRYIKLGYAELADQRGKPEVEHAVESSAKEERAVDPTEPVKRGPGRPRKD